MQKILFLLQVSIFLIHNTCYISFLRKQQIPEVAGLKYISLSQFVNPFSLYATALVVSEVNGGYNAKDCEIGLSSGRDLRA